MHVSFYFKSGTIAAYSLQLGHVRHYLDLQIALNNLSYFQVALEVILAQI